MKSKIKYAESIIPLLNERYEMYCLNPLDLVGQKVISIRPGFSCESGQIMIVESVINWYIRLVPAEETFANVREDASWGCFWNQKDSSFILYESWKEIKNKKIKKSVRDEV